MRAFFSAWIRKKLLHSNSFRYIGFLFTFAFDSSVAFSRRKNYYSEAKKDLFPPIFVQIVRHFQHLKTLLIGQTDTEVGDFEVTETAGEKRDPEWIQYQTFICLHWKISTINHRVIIELRDRPKCHFAIFRIIKNVTVALSIRVKSNSSFQLEAGIWLRFYCNNCEIKCARNRFAINHFVYVSRIVVIKNELIIEQLHSKFDCVFVPGFMCAQFAKKFNETAIKWLLFGIYIYKNNNNIPFYGPAWKMAFAHFWLEFL